MARNITAAFKTETKAEKLRPVILLEFQYPGGDINMWTGIGDLSWNAKTWTGAGDMLRISEVRETESIVASGMVFTLSGIPSAALSNALGQDYQDRLALMYVGAMDDNLAIVVDPYLVFEGRMDVQTINDDGDVATVEVTAENRLIDLERARKRRYTPEDQALEHSGDKGLDFIASLQNKDVQWQS